MKLSSIYISIFFACLVILASCKSKKENPTTDDYLPDNKKHLVVYDISNLFSTQQKDSLTKRLIDYELATTNQIAIATFDSIPRNTDVLHYATDIANKWGVGRQHTNNGLLILISKFDRQMAIATSIGTEKILTDSICSRIINNTIIPQFKEGNYFEGIERGLDSIIFKWK